MGWMCIIMDDFFQVPCQVISVFPGNWLWVRGNEGGREYGKLLPKAACSQHQQTTPAGRHRKRERKRGETGEKEHGLNAWFVCLLFLCCGLCSGSVELFQQQYTFLLHYRSSLWAHNHTFHLPTIWSWFGYREDEKLQKKPHTYQHSYTCKWYEKVLVACFKWCIPTYYAILYIS